MKAWHFLILGLALFLSWVGYMIYLSNEEQNHHEEMLGKKVVIQKDTLMILEYSSSHHCYLLSNKASIDCDLAGKLVIEK